MASSCPVTDDLAKDYLHGQLRSTRQALVWKLDGLSEYEVRRPLTATGTNLLGLVKHLATLEAWYFGEVFDRPVPGAAGAMAGRGRQRPVGDPGRDPRTDHRLLSARLAACGRDDQRAFLDAPGHVPWWSRPTIKLFTVMVHLLQETTRHAGHADILREQLDGRTGVAAEYEEQIDTAAREAYRAKIERAAQEAAGGSHHGDLSDTYRAMGMP
jgi:hypothetical protein